MPNVSPHRVPVASGASSTGLPLVPSEAELVVEAIIATGARVTIRVACHRRRVPCPRCGRDAKRVHSRYTRTLADLPWQGRAVCLVVRTRKFYCDWRTCRRRIFTERVPETVVPYGRRTCRAGNALTAIGLRVGARPGARLARQLSVLASADVILRHLHRRDVAPAATPRVLGVDDWAWAKRRVYGTILCDLERGRVIDLLPDRTSDTFAAWLRAHPGIEIISRDRGGEYARAARDAAPGAIQVADRFHLLVNLTAALTRVVAEHASTVRVAYQEACALTTDEATAPAADAIPRTRGAVHPPGQGAPVATGMSGATLAAWQREHGQRSTVSAAVRRSTERRARRLARYEQVCALHATGLSDLAIARVVGLDRRTVHVFWSAPAFPERATPPRTSAVAPFHGYLRTRVAAGCVNAVTLCREIAAQGYRGGTGMVRTFIAGLRPTAATPRPVRVAPPSPEKTVWLLHHVERCSAGQSYPITEREACFVTRLTAGETPELRIAHAARLVGECHRMFGSRDVNALRPWLAAAEVSPLARFARGLRRDGDAVLAALCFRESQGPVEGHVHRLKSVKRTMYGHGSFELLRQRVLYAAASSA
jgi:transposase